ncbi:aldo/keto reductase [Egibacter rhizosphaerae]|uniref:Aldo/keto reductase n=1 Tax=Egibacter rhizosphaerae TaxID=1670831 RepID=A0A411YJ86_9ACTN|nr:aldo/keto reductase family protein [Egibacter rhizosphaerae]QBI21348.1 aldo/keto reductase [Egibacter rhizosphaerae]
MEYRKLGRWGVKVSSVGLGSWLTYGGTVEEDQSTACIQRAYDLGVNFFDTANVYARGRSEEVVGKALASIPRDRYVLATKVYFPMGDGPNDSGLSRKHVTEQLHASLKRLGTEYVDLYQCHRYDTETPLEETCATMADLIRQGKVLYWGTSEWSSDQIAHAVSICRSQGWPEPASNQPQYSALWRRIEDRVLPTCEDLGIGNVVWSPLAMGVLTGKYRSVDDVPSDSRAAGDEAKFMRHVLTQPALDAVQEAGHVAEQAGVSLSQLALAWCLRQPAVSSVIVGATKTSHVDDNVGASGLEVPRDAVERFDELLAPVAAS